MEDIRATRVRPSIREPEKTANRAAVDEIRSKWKGMRSSAFGPGILLNVPAC
jgi:hypothetical protein